MFIGTSSSNEMETDPVNDSKKTALKERHWLVTNSKVRQIKKLNLTNSSCVSQFKGHL